MRSIRIAVLFAALTVITQGVATRGDPSAALPLTLRYQEAGEGGAFQIKTRDERWDPRKTTVIVCDMWDLHHCRNATLRVSELAPRMDKVLTALRERGVTVIHAPSSCMGFYNEHPARERAKATPRTQNPPPKINEWCHSIPGEERSRYPIDQSDGGEDDDPAIHQAWAQHLQSQKRNPRAPWKRQIASLTIDADRDYISDDGVEVWSILEQRGVTNVIVLGVHTNMCVLGRPFGLRQMARNGKNVVLMRDMTDTMYNPARWPNVSHYQGTKLIIDHIDRVVCPTISSEQVIGGEAFGFAWDTPTRVVVAVAEPEYKTEQTLPALAAKIWTPERGYAVATIVGDPQKHDLPGLTAALKDADVLVLSVRRQALPADQLDVIKAHVAAGKGLIALRTTSHAFDARGKGPAGRAEWPPSTRRCSAATTKATTARARSRASPPPPARTSTRSSPASRCPSRSPGRCIATHRCVRGRCPC